uniref:RGS domain-containing serine/threonine-protein kinase A-like n=1 Tax=Dermatophagoides pteronyssinus TaxID=6956 RepID=A0A6P6YCK5_DERPT|nr:RGS domain-containing serine/threonine-protein kinase A-like [Dermatophagoides pteronyssinus]
MATLHPFSSLHHWLECHTHIMLALTWVFGSAYAYIPFENTATRPFMLPSDNQTTYYECTYDNGVSVLKLRLFMTSNIVLTFILPLTVLIFSYSAIMRKLIADEKRFRKSSNHAYGVKFKSTICKSINNNPSNNPKRKSLSDNNSPSISNNNNSDQQQQSSLSLTPTKPCHHLANNHHHHHNSVLNEQNNCKCRCCCSCCSKQKLSKTLSSPISTSTTSTTTTTTAMNIATTTTIINSSEMDIIRPSSILSDINDDDGDGDVGVNSLTSSCDSCNHHQHHHHGNHHQQQQKKKRQTIKSGPCCLSTKTFQKSKTINNKQNNNNNIVGYPNGRLRLSAEELSIKRITNSSVQQSIATTTTTIPTPTTTTTTITPTTTTATLNQLSTSTSQIDLRKSTPFNYRSKTIKMMFTVILLYGICWMPIKLYQFLNDYGLIAYCTERELYAMICLYFICHWMAMANSFVNPIIYSFMSKSFRNDFSKITKTFRQTFSKNFNQHSIKTSSTQV